MGSVVATSLGQDEFGLLFRHLPSDNGYVYVKSHQSDSLCVHMAPRFYREVDKFLILPTSQADQKLLDFTEFTAKASAAATLILEVKRGLEPPQSKL